MFPSRLLHSCTAWKTLVILLFIFFIAYSHLPHDHGLSETSRTAHTSPHSVSSVHDDTQIEFTSSLPAPSPRLIEWWKSFIPFLLNAEPDCTPVEVLYEIPRELNWDPHNRTRPRIDALQLTDGQVKSLKASHRAMVYYAQQQASKLYYKRKTRGIVTTASTAYMSILVVSLRMLRESGSKLAVEVWLNDRKEYMVNRHYCEEVLPELNAECRLFSDILSEGPAIDIKSYQCKVFAMLLSSFEDMMFLDSDSFPVWNPDDFLLLDPFRSHGLVTWPDFWESTTSHFFFEIAGIDEPPLYIRPSSESGQMLLSKNSHAALLILAAYYNYYGPDYYYPLFSQGAQGQGDKETFLHAAMALDLPFYDVKRMVSVLGHWTDDEYKGLSMLQANPVEDYEVESHTRGGEPRGFFIHNNMCKLDPERVFEPHCRLQDGSGHWLRLWGPKDGIMEQFGYDVEERVWQQVVITACEQGKSDTCRTVKDYYQRLHST